MNSDPTTCVEYSKKCFKEFLNNSLYNEQIRKLLTLLVYKNNLDKSPYPEFKVDVLWNKVINMFINDCCNILSKYLLSLYLFRASL